MLAVPRASCSSFALGAKMRGIFPFSSVCHLVCDSREKGWVYEPDWQAWRRIQQIETPCQVVDPFDVLTFRVIISREWISSMWLCIPSIPNLDATGNVWPSSRVGVDSGPTGMRSSRVGMDSEPIGMLSWFISVIVKFGPGSCLERVSDPLLSS